MGLKREEIRDKCPEGFEDDLKDFIDDIESEINEALGLLDNIKSISDLDNVNDSYSIIKNLAQDLY